MDLRRISPALTREQKLAVVTVDEVMAQARVSTYDEVDLIAGYIEAAYNRMAGEDGDGYLRRACLLTEQFEYYTGSASDGYFEIPLQRVNPDSVTIQYLSGPSYSAVDSTLFYPVLSGGYYRLTRTTGGIWPYRGLTHGRAYRIAFQAGFGGAADIPYEIKLAIKMLAAQWYRDREATGSEGRAAAQDVAYGLRFLSGGYRSPHDHS